MFNSINQGNSIDKDESVYNSLYKLKLRKKSQPIPLYVQENDKKIQQNVLSILGYGGSKRVYELEKGIALVMPYGGSFKTANSKKWTEMIDEELMATKLVKSLGLLACDLEKVDVFMISDSIISLSAYRTETFTELSTKGTWVIDAKNPSSSTWKKTFFHENVDKFDEKNWEKLLHPFLMDIAKLLANNFWLYSDNVNMAVLEKLNQDDDISDYEIRYFGFDFSCKSSQLSFEKLSKENIASIVPSIVGDSLSCLMECEFDSYSEERKKLRQNLKERCIKLVLSNI